MRRLVVLVTGIILAPALAAQDSANHDPAAVRLADEERLAADVAERPHRRVHPAGDQGLGHREQFAGKHAGLLHGGMLKRKSGLQNTKIRHE